MKGQISKIGFSNYQVFAQTIASFAKGTSSLPPALMKKFSLLWSCHQALQFVPSLFVFQ